MDIKTMETTASRAKGRNPVAYYFAYLRKHPDAMLGTIVIALFALSALFAPLIAPYHPETPTDNFRSPPSAQHWFGTDSSGLDIFSRVIYAARIDLFIGITGTAVSMAIGIFVGLLAGYYRGWGSALVMRLADLLQAFPPFVLAMALVAIAGPRLENVILVIGVLTAPVFLRLVRSEVLAFRERPVMEAARCVGNRDYRVLRYYLLPNVIEAALVQASVNIGWAIMLTAGLSFIGAGIPVPTPEWGSMVGIGAQMMITGEWWAAFFPGLAIALCVMSFAAVGEAIRVLVNPERRP
jgi:peptide/nickel transport system permease protein